MPVYRPSQPLGHLVSISQSQNGKELRITLRLGGPEQVKMVAGVLQEASIKDAIPRISHGRHHWNGEGVTLKFTSKSKVELVEALPAVLDRLMEIASIPPDSQAAFKAVITESFAAKRSSRIAER